MKNLVLLNVKNIPPDKVYVSGRVELPGGVWTAWFNLKWGRGYEAVLKKLTGLKKKTEFIELLKQVMRDMKEKGKYKDFFDWNNLVEVAQKVGLDLDFLEKPQKKKAKKDAD